MAKEALFNDEGGYVKGVVTYVVMDDLVVKPMSTRGVNVRPNLRTRHELDTGFFSLGLGLNGFGS